MRADNALRPIELTRIGQINPDVHELIVVLDRAQPERKLESTPVAVNGDRNLVREMPAQAPGVGFAVRCFDPGFGNNHDGSEPIGKNPAQGARIDGMPQWLKVLARFLQGDTGMTGTHIGQSGRALTKLALLLLLGGQAGTAFAQDDDVLVTANGDRLTGEIKSLDRGMLRFDTDATDTISVKWTHVAALVSTQNFRVTLDNDTQFFGFLVESLNTGTLRFESDEGTLEIPALSVVRMTPIETRLADRIDMDVNLGYAITKASSVAQTTLGYDFSFRTEERLLSANLDATRSSSSDEPTSIRNNSTFSYRRFIDDRHWNPMGFGMYERNDELGLDRRVTLGGGMSRWLSDTNSHRTSFVGGLVGTRENETDALESDTSVEAAFGLVLDWFRYDDPELDVSTTLAVYERLSGESRTRGNLDVDLRWELINDFFWGFSVYYTFNTKPTGNASSNDYGVVSSVGWSF